MNLLILNHTNICHESNNDYILIKVCCGAVLSDVKHRKSHNFHLIIVVKTLSPKRNVWNFKNITPKGTLIFRYVLSLITAGGYGAMQFKFQNASNNKTRSTASKDLQVTFAYITLMY